ncbi:MAG: extracellular solute-binding protein, partial [Thaumarchaeota archaeon]|nr:extracellular solute-binding protein [Nitrososphaerota archaeon]
ERAAQEAQRELEGLQADKALEEAAKKENAPLIYGVMDAPDFLNIVWPRFRETYPWAPAEGRYIEGFAPLRSRFISEFQANAPSADIVWQSEAPMIAEMRPYMAPFPDMKFTGLYSGYFGVPDNENPAMFITFLLPYVLGYNTNLVKAEEAPQSWFDLADPKWKGKIIMQDATRLETSAKLLANLQLAMGQTKWEEFMRGLAANEPVWTGSNTEAYTRVVAGEFPITTVLINDIIRQDPGTPVAVAWPKKDILQIDSGALTMIGISQKAQNPNFAKLFVTWALSPDGQKAMAETGRPPRLFTVDHPNSLGKVIPSGISILDSNFDFLQDPKKWETIIRGFFE